MILPSSSLSPHLQKAIGSLYLITGECPILLEETTQTISQAWHRHTASELTESEKFWIEDPKDWETLLERTCYSPLFSTTQLIDAKFYKKTLDVQGKTHLMQYLEKPQTHTLLVIQAPYLSSKNLQFLAKTSTAHVIQNTPLKGGAFIKWITDHLIKRGIQTAPDVPKTIAYFTEGNALAAIHCIKLLDLLKPSFQSFTVTDLQTVLSDTAQFPLYALTETYLTGNLEHALRLLKNLQHQAIEPLLVLWWLTKTIRQLIQILNVLQQGDSFSAACKTLQIWSSQEALYRSAQKRLPLSTLTELLHKCQQMDKQLKSSNPTFIWDDFEYLALHFCVPTVRKHHVSNNKH